MASLLALSACTDALRRPEAEPPAPVVQKSRPGPAEQAPAAPATAPVPPSPVTAASASPPSPPHAPARKRDGTLQAGIEAYENGDYPAAQQRLQAALGQGLGVQEQILAHKYLAFISCATGLANVCESHFRRILTLDRNFRLSAAEAGHPQWGPVFRKLRNGRK